MGTIIERKRRDGSTAYMAQILIMRDRKIIHRESKTFDRKQAAEGWIKKREAELAKPGAVFGNQKRRGATLAEAIDRYIAESVAKMGRTKAQVLRSIKSYSIAEMACADIRSHDVMSFARELGTSMQPQTVGNYLSHLGAVFAIARPAWGFDLNQSAMKDAYAVAKRLGVTKKGNSRTRRPTLAELDKLMGHFAARTARAPASSPMCAIIAFAIFSTRRQEEITRIRWADLDEAHSRILVRDMKHPGQKAGNDVWCDLTPEALKIALAQPRTALEIFPYDGKSISAAFTRACLFLGIGDLRFHDLRHEGVSRLFELGKTIPQVACFSGHRSWQSLQRYAHIREAGDKYAGWKWTSVDTL